MGSLQAPGVLAVGAAELMRLSSETAARPVPARLRHIC